MKSLFTLCLAFLALTSFAGKRISILEYQIVSDVYDSAIPKGTCVVGGQVLYEQKGLDNSLISTLDFEKQAITDTSGVFRLVLSDNDSSIFFFHTGFSETVIYNYDFKSQHAVTIKFFAQINYMQTVVDKPVIYCYSEEPVEASILLNPQSELSFTYPVLHENNWNVEVEGNRIKVDGQSYPYLFWEGKTDNLNFQPNATNELEGYLIKTDTVVSFLENTLTAYGLNQIEKTDFITFWGPRMIQEEYALVQFIVDDDYAELIAGITLNPQPDAMFRLFMMFTPLPQPQTNFKLVQPTTIPFSRSGFTVLEWGGAEIQSSINTLSSLKN